MSVITAKKNIKSKQTSKADYDKPLKLIFSEPYTLPR